MDISQLPRGMTEEGNSHTAMIPNMRLHVAVSALPVPRCGVGNSSGVKPYSTAYMILLVKLYAQFQPNKPSDVTAVVEP
jgi:hypothetical protein